MFHLVKIAGLCCIIVVIGLLGPVSAGIQEVSEPHFRSGIIELPPFTVMSAQGTYLAGIDTHLKFNVNSNETENLTGSDDEVIINLWDTREFESNETLIQPSPITSSSIEYRLAKGRVSDLLLAFSPDEKYLAVRKDFDLTILTVPDLEIHQIIPFPAMTSILPGDIQWSNDSNLIAANVDPLSLVVWNLNNQELYSYEDYFRGPITAVNNGWITKWYYVDSVVWAFTACTRLLEKCILYDYKGFEIVEQPAPVMISPDGQIIMSRLAQESSGDTAIWAWRRQDNGSYQLAPEPLKELGTDRIYDFSGDGLYIATYDNSRIERRDVPITIRDAKTFEVVQSTEDYCEFRFFPEDSEHFVTKCGVQLNIYRVGINDPLDTLNIEDWLEFTPVDNIDFAQLVIDERFIFEPTISSLSLDGQWLLFHFGSGDALISVVR